MPYIPYTKIVSILNIKRGDIFLVSSDVWRFALAAVKHRERFIASLFIQSILDAVGEQGTVLFPTYNWNFCQGLPFDIRKTPCMTGSLGQEALKIDGFRRTAHPIYSFAVWGKDRDMLCAMNNISSFGSDSPFAYLHHNAKALIIDVSLQNSFTFAHYVEEQVNVPYRYQKMFTAEYTDYGGNIDIRSYSMFVRDLERDVQNIIDPIGEDMEAAGKLEKVIINDVHFSMLRFSDFYVFAKLDIIENKAKKLCYYSGQDENVRRMISLI